MQTVQRQEVCAEPSPASRTDLACDNTKYLAKNVRPTGPHLVSGRGAVVFDSTGKEYIDLCSQTLNMNLGQCHPRIVEVVSKMANGLTFVSSRFRSTQLLDLAARLVEISPKGLTKVNLKLCNGSDANESALKRARRYTGKAHVISFHGSHLGESSETLSASGHSEERPYLGGSGKYILVDPPKSRPPGDDSRYDGEWFEGFKRVVVQSSDVAGIIVEPIMVDAGAIVFPRDDLEQMRSLCTEYDIPLIFDEIQTAGGWLGTLLASTKLDVTPDMITLGKGLSGGYPLAAVLMHENYDVLQYGEDEYTYGSHPLPCATALATLDVLQKTDLLEQVRKKATRIEGHLARLKHKHPAVADYRGEGLLWGIEIREHESGWNGHTRRVFETLLRKGVISRIASGGNGNVLIVKPPLVITEGEIDRAFEAIDDAFAAVSAAT